MSTAQGFPSCDELDLIASSPAPATEQSSRRFCSPMVTGWMFVLASVAFGSSIYLSWASLTSSNLAGCGAGELFDCSHVTNTKWANVFGVPVSIPAVALYGAMLVSLTVTRISKSAEVVAAARDVIAFGALTAAFAGAWFITLQVAVLGHFCLYCLVTHVCGIVLAALVLRSVHLNKYELRTIPTISILAIAILAVGQTFAKAPPSYEIETFVVANDHLDESDGSATDDAAFLQAPSPEPTDETIDQQLFLAPGFGNDDADLESATRAESKSSVPLSMLSAWGGHVAMVTVDPFRKQQTQDAGKTDTQTQRIVSLQGGRVKLSASQWPMIGKVDAKCVMVEMFDYTCPHCRKNHKTVADVRKKMGDEKLAIMALAVPMNSKCNSGVQTDNPKHKEACELAKLSTALWRVDAARFAEFHDWLFEGEYAPTYQAAYAKASELVDSEKLKKEMSGSLVSRYVESQVKIYQRVGAGVVPKLFLPNATVSGDVGSTESLVQLIQKAIGSR